MAKLLQIGISFPHEMSSDIGHVACTLGGVNYESRGGAGILRGSAARSASNGLFRHRFHIRLSETQAKRAKRYADRCVGRPYVWGGVPKMSGGGGDCSGYVSGIICAALGKSPIRRLFATGNWSAKAAGLGFKPGLGGGSIRKKIDPIGVADRPFPGFAIERNSLKRNHVKWIQARLNFAFGNKHEATGGFPLLLDGEFGPVTERVVKAFQRKKGLQGLGMVGPKTWKLLNALR